MFLVPDYDEVRHTLTECVFSHNGEARLCCNFSAPLYGEVMFEDLLLCQHYTGTFELSQKAKSKAYIIKLTLPKPILNSRMPKLNYTITKVKYLQDALSYMLNLAE